VQHASLFWCLWELSFLVMLWTCDLMRSRFPGLTESQALRISGMDVHVILSPSDYKMCRAKVILLVVSCFCCSVHSAISCVAHVGHSLPQYDDVLMFALGERHCRETWQRKWRPGCRFLS